MDVTRCLELSPSSFLHVSIKTNSSFIWTTPLRGEATQHVITHLLACFEIMGTPISITTALPIFLGNANNFYNHFLLNILVIPYNPQAQGIV